MKKLFIVILLIFIFHKEYCILRSINYELLVCKETKEQLAMGDEAEDGNIHLID